MPDLLSVRPTGERRSHWVACGPGGKRIEWDAEITEERPNELISWRSLPGADLDNSGTVSFRRAPGDRGTIVRVEMRYRPPGGSLGAAIARLFRDYLVDALSNNCQPGGCQNGFPSNLQLELP